MTARVGITIGSLLVLAAVLSACAAAEGRHDSPSYAAGFTDGCATASARAARQPGGEQRDQTLFKRDRDYRSGWRAGYASCGTTAPTGPLGTPPGRPFAY